MPISQESAATHAPTPDPLRGFPTPYWAAPGAALYLGDVRACLRRIPARSVHEVVTSPPYWALRDYSICKCCRCGCPDPTCSDCGGIGHLETMIGQLGLEGEPDCLGWATGAKCGECYVCHMVEVFSEVKRVLRDDGTVWLNLGDTYGGHSIGEPSAKQDSNRGSRSVVAKNPLGFGNLVGVPWRVALAMQADGWVLRGAMPWIKRNAMPDSAENRPGRAVEDVFLLTKGGDYFYDGESIKPAGSWPGRGGAVFSKNGGDQHRRYDRPDYKKRNFRSSDLFLSSVGEIEALDVPVANYSGAHFATFAPRLITPMILAGTSGHGTCAECRRQYEPVVIKERGERVEDDGYSRDRSMRGNRNGLNTTLYDHIGGAESDIVGWRKMCGCRTNEVIPAVVLDPFVGSGTTVATAVQLGRAGVGIDLNEEYLREHAVKRVGEALGIAGPRATVALPPSAPLAVKKLRG